MSTLPAPASPRPDSATDQSARLWLLRAAKALVVFVYVVVIVNLVLLVLGFFLQLFGASTDAEFTRWVYRNVERIMEPFRGMFPSHAVSDQSVLDVSLLFAMVVYSLVGIAVHALVTWLADKIVILRRRQQVALRSDPELVGPAIPPAGPTSAASHPEPRYR